ncbi:cell invasion protein [Salmonella enterica subsp. salamae]|uniref:Cell invasion protein n=1 Tax=Salmonella enterica subsp. salamae TaxID=59202 RepID=A0A6D2G4D5_SALER|nr:cell invasion protein [Salmonella enterica subsp. salamae]
MRLLLQANSLIYLPIAFLSRWTMAEINFEIQVDTDTTEIILHELKEGNSESRSVAIKYANTGLVNCLS